MSMSDEQFEKAINKIWLFSQSMADQLRARNTAQREALVRVEAERDAERARGDAAVGDANEAEAQLAEAVGLLRKAIAATHFSEILTLERDIPAFLSRHAQADQQEAREPVLARPEHGASLDEAMTMAMDRYSGALDKLAVIEQQEASEGDWPNGANVKLKWIRDETELTGWARLEAGILYSVHSGVPLKTGCWKIVEDRSGGAAASRQEAQGAQAGDEARKAAFENHWYAQKATAFGSTEAQRHFDAGWQARAALATQPAAGEPVEIEVPTFSPEGMGCGLEDRGITDRYEAMEYGYNEALEQQWTIINNHGPLFAAPPAAAHGDDAVRKMVMPERIDRRQYLGGRGDAVAQGWNDCLNWIDKANAMRAQGDGGEV